MLSPFAQQNPAGLPAFTAQGISTFPGAHQPQAFAQPFATNPSGNFAPSQFGGYGTSFTPQPLQQIVQSLLIVPQQLQHLLQLAQIQQHQVQYLLQSIPQQLQQLQQVVHQSGFQSSTPYQAWGTPQTPFGIPQAFGTQPGYVM